MRKGTTPGGEELGKGVRKATTPGLQAAWVFFREVRSLGTVMLLSLLTSSEGLAFDMRGSNGR